MQLIDSLVDSYKDPSLTTREKGSEDMFGLMALNMKGSGRTTCQMEKARGSGRRALRTRVSVGVV